MGAEKERLIRKEFLIFYNKVGQKVLDIIDGKIEESVHQPNKDFEDFRAQDEDAPIRLTELKEAIEQWAVNRDLHEAPPEKQMLKVSEEVGELASAIAKRNRAGQLDALGDTVVTLIILAMQLGCDLTDCVGLAYNEIKDRKGKMIDGVYIKEEDLT